MALMRFDPFREFDRLAEQASAGARTARGDNPDPNTLADVCDHGVEVGDTQQGQKAIHAEFTTPQPVDA